MTKRRSHPWVLLLTAGLTLSSAQALTVFDPSNYAQNVIQAARAARVQTQSDRIRSN
jgi:type IV secretion system protein TrbJ